MVVLATTDDRATHPHFMITLLRATLLGPQPRTYGVYSMILWTHLDPVRMDGHRLLERSMGPLGISLANTRCPLLMDERRSTVYSTLRLLLLPSRTPVQRPHTALHHPPTTLQRSLGLGITPP